MDSCRRRSSQELPHTCLQWEDFATPNARPLLLRYQNELLTFNDDVQGTAAVVLGAVIGASKVARKSIKEHQIVFVGAGSAAIGVADYLRVEMVEEGLSENEARARFWIVDKDGLLVSDRRDLSDEQKPYARARNEIADWPRSVLSNCSNRPSSLALLILASIMASVRLERNPRRMPASLSACRAG
jgi:malate dehydrogenase (oxaloacetate-decarboxylating)